MRISDRDLAKIKTVFAEVLPPPYQLRVFGSRLDDSKLGGDIDLLLIVSSDRLEQTRRLKFVILDGLYVAIGEQKIDLLIVDQKQMESDVFLSSLEGLSI